LIGKNNKKFPHKIGTCIAIYSRTAASTYRFFSSAIAAVADQRNSINHFRRLIMANQQNQDQSNTSNRGFASMDPEKQREIASQGGQAAHEKGTAHEFTSEEAREAGRKGGEAAHAKGTAHEFTSEEAREAGRKGGQASQGGGQNNNQSSRGGSSEQHAEAGRQSHKNS
jgi:uncharacterized protein